MMKFLPLLAVLAAALAGCGDSPRTVVLHSPDGAPKVVTFAPKKRRAPAEVTAATIDKLANRFAKLSMAELRLTLELAQSELDVREENADTGSIPAELLDAPAAQRDCR